MNRTRRKVPGRAIYVGTLVALFGVLGGYALATIAVSASTQNAEGNYVSAGSGVTGLTYASTVLNTTTNPAPAASTGTGSAPQALANGANAFCANTCAAGNFAEVVTYTFSTSLSGAFELNIQVQATSGGGQTTLFLKAPATNNGGTISLTWDLGAGSNTITSLTVTAQQCSSATSCP